MIKVAIADDHCILRDGIVNILQSSGRVNVIAEAGTVEDTRAMLDKHPEIDILICDINFPDGTGYEVLEYIQKFNKSAKVVFLTMHDRSSFATKAIEGGAMGYLTKDAVKEELLTALVNVREGKKYFGQNIMNSIVENFNKPKDSHDFFRKVLSKRELEVLDLVIEGLDTNEISDKLFISEKTAANYRNSIMQKCNVKNVIQLMKLYLQHA